MLIVGEKINTSTKRIAQAVETGDAAFIAKVACEQVAAGADFIDVNAGTFLKEEVDYLPWLVETVQSAVDIPLCLDTPNPEALVKALECHKGEPMINSISLEEDRFRNLLPVVTSQPCKVVALCMGQCPRHPGPGLIATMDVVGDQFSKGLTFVPQMLRSAKTMQECVELLKPHFQEGGVSTKGKVVLGTVKGDLHDIGKNLVAMMLEGAGFTILDLGVDVSPETFVQEVKKENMGVDIGDIDVIYLAGALGNYINPYSAMRIGLIPRLDPEKITPLGNAASTGAKMVLLSRRCWEKSAQNLKVVISNKRTPNQLPHQTR